MGDAQQEKKPSPDVGVRVTPTLEPQSLDSQSQPKSFLQVARRDNVEMELSSAIGQSVGCTKYFDALFYCYSPTNQMSTYYRKGTVDPCMSDLSDVWMCLKLKMNYSAEEKKEMKRHLEKQGDLCSSANVWAFREDPAAEWKPTLQK